MRDKIEISIIELFQFQNQSQRELESVKSTFSALNSFIQQTDDNTNEFIKNLNRLNDLDLSKITKSADGKEGTAFMIFRLGVEDPDNILERVENVDEQTLQVQIEQTPSLNSGETPQIIKASAAGAIAAAITAIGLALTAPVSVPIAAGALLTAAAIGIVQSYIQAAESSSEQQIRNTNFELVPGFANPEALEEQSKIAAIWAGNYKEVQENGEQVKQIVDNLNQSVGESNQLNQQQIINNKENAAAVLEVSDNRSTLAEVNKVVAENLKEQADQAEQAEKTLGDLSSTTDDTNINTEQLAGNAEDLADNMKDSGRQIAQAEKTMDGLGGASGVASTNLERAETAAQQLGENGLPKVKDSAEQAGEGIKKSAEDGKNALTSLGVFAANIATEIAKSFSDFISTALKGDFDGIEDLWDNLLDSLQDAFADFVAGLIANPIRLAFEATVNGEEGNIFDLIGGLFSFGGSGDSSSSSGNVIQAGNVVTALQNPFDVGGISDAVRAFNDASDASEGILSTLSSVAGTVGKVAGIIGTIVAVVLSLVNVIKGLFDKGPRLDLDFDQFRDADGVSIGIAATVADLFDSDTFLNEIFNTSVSRQAGLGLNGGAGKVIQEAIATQIEEIQDIINTLPFELAAQLNEALLNTPVDIESKIKGDRLLEFDETKDIAKKFDDFINGDLQARFLFSIRDFFVGAFESLGVLGSAAQNFIDAEFEAFQGLNREQRAEAGKELLEDFQTLVDAFNVLNNNGADSIGATVNSIKNLSNTLGFEGVPSIEELDAGLEELINAAELDPDIIQDYLDLRNAILEAQRAILGSIQSIISSISSLNSIITGAGGSAFDLGGFINQGIGSVIGLLGQEGLSIEDQEELLGLGTGFLDQLIAEEQAAFQAQLEAAQEAAEAAAEAQRNAIRAQIDGLEEEKRLIEENFDARIEALQEELRIAEEFARLTESIQQTLDSIILGPDSVFTAVERLNIVQGNIANLQSELAATTDPERQLELAGQLEDSLSTLFDLAGEAFGVNSPEFTAIFDQVTGGLNDLLDLTGNRTRSVEEINAEIEALNIERNQQLEAIDAQISNLNDQLSSIQAQNVDATFQVSDQVLEYAEFFRGEYVRLLEERFAQLGEVSETGFATEIEALESVVSELTLLNEKSDRRTELGEQFLIALRDIQSTLSGAPQFMGGSGGFRDFGSGTLAFLHGNEAVIRQDTFVGFINDIASSFRGSLESNVAENFGTAIGDLNRFRLPLRFDEFENFFTTRPGSVGQTESGGDMNVNINVNVDGGSAGTVDSLATNIEDMLVRSIRQGGKLRSAVQEAGAKRLN